MGENGPGERMAATRLDSGGPLEEFPFGMGRKGNDLHYGRRPSREGSCLVERDRLQRSGRFKVDPPFDENAVSRRGREGGHDGDGT